MTSKSDLQDWVREALHDEGGQAPLIHVAKSIWARHRKELESSGDLFYTWQYDMRWAANVLRRRGIMKPIDRSPRGIWELVA